MVHAPEMCRLSQARRLGEIEDIARSLIAVRAETRANSAPT
ncbi:MAG TPA: hypothetical protein VFR17_03930 [Mycobacterium sp.]|nr:hypothetical protein [Mycobacterium sp.]